MVCEDPALFKQWTSHWEDLANFEIVHVVSSSQAADATLAGRALPVAPPLSVQKIDAHPRFDGDLLSIQLECILSRSTNPRENQLS